MQDDKSVENIEKSIICDEKNDGEGGKNAWNEESDFRAGIECDRIGYGGCECGVWQASADEEENAQCEDVRLRQYLEVLEKSGHKLDWNTFPSETADESEKESSDEERRNIRFQSELTRQGIESEENKIIESDWCWEQAKDLEDELPYVQEDIVAAVWDSATQKSPYRGNCVFNKINLCPSDMLSSCLKPMITKYCLPKQIYKELEEEKKMLKKMDRIECSLSSISKRIDRLARTGSVCKKHATRRPEISEEEIEEPRVVEKRKEGPKKETKVKKEPPPPPPPKEKKRVEKPVEEEPEEEREEEVVEEKPKKVTLKEEPKPEEEDECEDEDEEDSDECLEEDDDDSLLECVGRMSSVDSRLGGALLSSSFDGMELNLNGSLTEELARQLCEKSESIENNLFEFEADKSGECAGSIEKTELCKEPSDECSETKSDDCSETKIDDCSETKSDDCSVTKCDVISETKSDDSSETRSEESSETRSDTSSESESCNEQGRQDLKPGCYQPSPVKKPGEFPRSSQRRVTLTTAAINPEG